MYCEDKTCSLVLIFHLSGSVHHASCVYDQIQYVYRHPLWFLKLIWRICGLLLMLFLQVLIRIRPINDAENASHGEKRCLLQDSSKTLSWNGPPETMFTFDHVACETISQVSSVLALFSICFWKSFL
jgi:hypothetical protein